MECTHLEHEVRRIREDMERDRQVERFLEAGSDIEIRPEGAPRRPAPGGDMWRMVRREMRENGAALDASTSPSQTPTEVHSDASSSDVRVEEAEPILLPAPSAVRLPATGTAPAAVGPRRTMDLPRRSRSPRDQYRRPHVRARPIVTPAGSAPPPTPFIPNMSEPFVNPREQLLVHTLQSGRSVQFRATGDALCPVVRHGEVTTFEPVTDPSTLVVGDIAFVCLQPRGRCYGLMIYGIQQSVDRCTWLVRDMHEPPVTSGSCLASHILGRLACADLIWPSADAKVLALRTSFF